MRVAGADQGHSRQLRVITLDRRLPNMRLDVVRQLRQAGVRTPVLLLSALGEVKEARDEGGDGGDDYLTKHLAFVSEWPPLYRCAVEPIKRNAGDADEMRRLERRSLGLTRSEKRKLDLKPRELRLLATRVGHQGHVNHSIHAVRGSVALPFESAHQPHRCPYRDACGDRWTYRVRRLLFIPCADGIRTSVRRIEFFRTASFRWATSLPRWFAATFVLFSRSIYWQRQIPTSALNRELRTP